MARQLNKKSTDLIQSFEQLRLKAYQGSADRDGVFTIGWGHVITGHEEDTHGIDLFRPGQMIRDVAITQSTADLIFQKDVDIFIGGLAMRMTNDVLNQLNDDQFGSLVSLAFNIGLGWFDPRSTPARQCSVYRKIRDGDIQGAADSFKSFVSSNGQRQNGLVRRRAAEKALYLSDYGKMDQFMENARASTIEQASSYLGLEE